MLDANVDRVPLKSSAVEMRLENWGCVGEECVVSQGRLFSRLAKLCPDS